MVFVKIKETSVQAKKLVDILKTFSYVEIIDQKESLYNQKFVKKIKDAEKRAEYKSVDVQNLWESIK